MKLLWGEGFEPPKTYLKYDRAVQEAERIIGERNIKVIIAATEGGRFFPVAIGEKAAQEGLHFHMCITS